MWHVEAANVLVSQLRAKGFGATFYAKSYGVAPHLLVCRSV